MSESGASDVPASGSDNGAHHRPSASTASAVSFAPSVDYVTAEQDGPGVSDSPEPEDDDPSAHKTVRVWWTAPFSRSLQLFASSNAFREPLELTGSAEEGYSARVPARKGQDLLYRFAVDGEFQTAEDAPIIQFNGDEYNVLHVSEDDDEDEDEDGKQGQHDEEPAAAPHAHRRQSSRLVWDNQRSTLLIADDEAAAAEAEKSDATTPAKTNASEPRFVGTGVDAPQRSPVSSPRSAGSRGLQSSESVDGDDSGDDGTEGGLTRTQRKNARHRQKQKEKAAQQQAAMGAQSHQILLQHLHRLRMEMQKRESDWKQAWVSHEMRTYQEREAERAKLKTQAQEERTKWLQKAKELTAELEGVRGENVSLKAEVQAAASAKKLEKSTVRRSEKFQTLQRNVLNDEMMIWLQEKNRMQTELDAMKAQKDEVQAQCEALKQAQQQSAEKITTLGINMEAREREIATLRADKDGLSKQLAATASDAGSEAQGLKEQLAAAQAKFTEAAQEANAARSEAQMQVAQVASLKEELASKAAESDAQRAAAARTEKEQQTTIDALKSEVSALQQKQLTAQESLFQRQTDLEQAQLDREEAEQRVQTLEASTAARIAEYEKSLAAARSSSNELASKVLSLNSSVNALRAQVSSLGELQRQQLSSFTKHIADAQTFLVDALQVQSNLLQTTMRKYKKEMSERRKLHNLVAELRGNIRVYCRVRPPKEEELKDGGVAISIAPPAEVGDPCQELTLDLGKKEGPKVFEFDATFGSNSTQGEVFEQIVSLVTSVLDGYNVCLFAYGQTGAGKTHTMQGTKEDPGMNLRSLTELFRLRQERRDDVDYAITVNFFEIYNENIYDLLDSNRDKEIKIRQGATGVFVDGLVARPVQCEEDVIALMSEGNKNRSVGSTSMNAHSSRSHSILSVHVAGHSTVMGMQLRGTLHLIDLAGSERVGRSNATGERLKEAQAINLSLSALGNVIEALQKRQTHVPYRNSKLTYILSNSLGGHAKTLMMVNCSPAARDAEETACSLQFATRVRATEIGAASKNVSSGAAGGDAPAAASAAPAAAGGPSSPPPKRAVGSVSAAAPSSALKARVVPGSAVKKPAAAAGAPGSVVKKPVAK